MSNLCLRFRNTEGFELICFSKEREGNQTIDNSAFTIKFERGEILTVRSSVNSKLTILLGYKGTVV